METQPAVKKLSGLAVASLLCGIMGFLPFCLPAGITGIVLGIIFLFKNYLGKAAKRGLGYAIAGILLSAVSLVLYISLIQWARDAFLNWDDRLYFHE